VEKPRKLNSMPVMTADHVKKRKGNTAIPALRILIFLVLYRKKKETAETEITAKIMSSTLYNCKYSLRQTPWITKSVTKLKIEKPNDNRLINFSLEIFAFIKCSSVFESSILSHFV
jgi:hypothetical protein